MKSVHLSFTVVFQFLFDKCLAYFGLFTFCKIELKSRLMVCTQFVQRLKTWTSVWLFDEPRVVYINFCSPFMYHLICYTSRSLFLFFFGDEYFQSKLAITQTVHIKDLFFLDDEYFLSKPAITQTVHIKDKFAWIRLWTEFLYLYIYGKPVIDTPMKFGIIGGKWVIYGVLKYLN